MHSSETTLCKALSYKQAGPLPIPALVLGRVQKWYGDTEHPRISYFFPSSDFPKTNWGRERLPIVGDLAYKGGIPEETGD